MTSRSDADGLIEDLVTDLRPVRRLAPPWLRAAGWLLVVLAAAAVLSRFGDLHALVRRLAAEIDMQMALAGSTVTAVLATLAAFQLSLPDRSRAWALLPLPTAALWLGSSGMGCLDMWLQPGMAIGTISGAADDCMMLVVGISLPLSILLFLMLRRARPLRPGLVAGMGGLAAAAAAASLLWIVHPFETAASAVAVHVVAVLIVIGLARVAGSRALGG